MELAWCQASDAGLPAPDVILFMDLSIEAAGTRGGFGGERYETTAFQTAVRARFDALRREVEGSAAPSSAWVQVDAAGSIEDIHGRLRGLVQPILAAVGAGGVPIRSLWGGDALPAPEPLAQQ